MIATRVSKLAAAAVVSFAASVALGNLVVNSGFEDPPITDSFAGFGAGQRVGPGWVVGSGEVDIIRNTLWLARSGFQSLDLNESEGVAGSVHQDLATVPGQVYSLDFWMAGNMFDSPQVKRMEVFWGGTSLGVFQ